MKNKTGHKIKLGVFVSISIALFIAGIYFIGQKKQLFNNTFHITAVFKDINGLQLGNNIRFSGINVGVVEDIEQITDSTVQVTMLIDASSKKFIKKNAKASIGSDGLMGDKIVVIAPGTPGQPEIANNDKIETLSRVHMDEILAKVKVAVDNTAIVSEQLAQILSRVNSGSGTLSRLLRDSSIAENINQTIVNLKKSSKGIDENVEAVKHNFFLKGYFNRKARAARKKKEEDEKKSLEKQKANDINNNR